MQSCVLQIESLIQSTGYSSHAIEKALKMRISSRKSTALLWRFIRIGIVLDILLLTVCYELLTPRRIFQPRSTGHPRELITGKVATKGSPIESLNALSLFCFNLLSTILSIIIYYVLNEKS
jgi:hypothetical protein